MASKFYTLLESIIDRTNGTAKSINGISPNAAGEVTIKEPINLLDNSDFRDPINQQGLTEYVGSEINTIDRWKTISGDVNNKVTILDGDGITIGYQTVTNGTTYYTTGWVEQFIDVSKIGDLRSSKKYTMVARSHMYNASWGQHTYYTEVLTGSFSEINTSSIANKAQMEFGYDSDRDIYYARIGSNSKYHILWAALYEGEYTEDTLPEYKPKDRLSELAECYRYYRVFNFTNYIGAGLSTSEIYFNVDLGGIPMRSQPTVTMVTKPTTVYVEGATGSWVIDESTVALQNYTDGDTVLGVYSKSTKTATYVANRATRVNAVGFIFDARP